MSQAMNRKTFNSTCRKQTKPSGLWGAPLFPIGISEVEIHQGSLLPGILGSENSSEGKTVSGGQEGKRER